jgi:hypothetical protein
MEWLKVKTLSSNPSIEKKKATELARKYAIFEKRKRMGMGV